MALKRKIKAGLTLQKIISIVVMMASLWFLTGVNFFLFPPGNTNFISASIDKEDNQDPPNPVEEKSPENKGLTSIQEEYLHEHSTNELVCINQLSLHKIHTSEKLVIVYYEIIAPPPKV